MRQRERLRIEKARKAIKNEKARLTRASNRNRSSLNGKAEYEARRAILKARAKVQSLQAKLAIAMLAPTRDAMRDVVKRPERYANPPKRRAKIERDERKTEIKIARQREITLTGKEGRAEKLLMDAFKRGEKLDDIYKRIAKETGLSANAVFSIGKYAQTSSSVKEEPDDSDGDSPDDFDNF